MTIPVARERTKPLIGGDMLLESMRGALPIRLDSEWVVGHSHLDWKAAWP